MQEYVLASKVLVLVLECFCEEPEEASVGLLVVAANNEAVVEISFFSDSV